MEEQRKAGMLLDDTAPIKLSVAPVKLEVKKEGAAAASIVQTFAADDEEELAAKKRKMPLVKLDFSALDSAEKMRERLDKMRESIPREKEPLFKARVRWDALNDVRGVYTLQRLAYKIRAERDRQEDRAANAPEDGGIPRRGGRGAADVCDRAPQGPEGSAEAARGSGAGAPCFGAPLLCTDWLRRCSWRRRWSSLSRSGGRSSSRAWPTARACTRAISLPMPTNPRRCVGAHVRCQLNR